jgi:hypothetical protein
MLFEYEKDLVGLMEMVWVLGGGKGLLKMI